MILVNIIYRIPPPLIRAEQRKGEGQKWMPVSNIPGTTSKKLELVRWKPFRARIGTAIFKKCKNNNT